MSQQNPDKKFDQGWSWPNKTWFQQRLALVRARERDVNRKPFVRKGQVTTETLGEESQERKSLSTST